ncbi:thioredoxin family protein [Paenibacillus puldeungensis]|uniref:Thioredoxin family protein n=1 Tax=Paenibacillus puldeungensis TaxID=696536 RepID=A0ABW3S2T8_9BACL
MKEIYELTSMEQVEEFLQNHKLSFLYVSRPECSVCHAILPKLGELLDDYPPIFLGHIDANQVPEVAGRFLVFSVPTMLMFIDQKEYLREDRFIRFVEFKEKLDLLAENLL